MQRGWRRWVTPPAWAAAALLVAGITLVPALGLATGAVESPWRGRASTVNVAASTLLLDAPSQADAAGRVGLERGTLELANEQLVVGDHDTIDWADDRGRGRSFLRQLHGLMPVRDLAVLAATGDEPAARLALRIVDAWQAANPQSDPADPMAWHDETTAQRLLTLVQLDAALRSTGAFDDRLDELGALMREHVDLLLDPGFHSTGTNHGMFQDHALLAWATSAAAAEDAGAAETMRTAADRLVDYLEGTVSADGVHLEHAPAYHQLIAQNMASYTTFFAVVADHASGSALDETRRRMARYATHVIQPDGTFPLVADTFVRDRPVDALFDDEAYRFAATAGAEGRRPEDTAAFFLDAGYAIMRDDWDAGDAGTYIHFSAAFHGTYHKHADDLSVWLYDAGPLLTEAGPNGYDYDDPFTIYGFGPTSHNVVLVDGRGVPRTEGRTDMVKLFDAATDGPVSTASGITRRLPGATHTRTVRYDRSMDLVTIDDELTSTQSHAYTVVWHLAAGVSSHPSGQGLALERDGRQIATLVVSGPGRPRVESLRGKRDPDGTVVGGWRLGGGEPVPSETLWVTFDGAPGTTRLVTEVRLEPSG